MFVGHAALAFALVALGARAAGVRPERALTVGVVAGAFATVPDVDILYGPVGLVRLAAGEFAAGATVPALAGAFWSTGNEIHRGVTHSVVLAVPTALAVWGIARWLGARGSLDERGRGLVQRERGRVERGRGAVPTDAATVGGGVVAVVLGAVLVVGPAVHASPLAGAVMLAAVAAAFVVAAATMTFTRLRPRTVGLAALAGLASHPFGDFFTGSPPAIAYPFGPVAGGTHVALHPDPTLHLLSAFLLELGIVWLAVVVAIRLRGGRVRSYLHPRATVGVGYAAAAIALPAPTLEVSYHFVIPALAVGIVGATPRLEAAGAGWSEDGDEGRGEDGDVGRDGNEVRSEDGRRYFPWRVRPSRLTAARSWRSTRVHPPAVPTAVVTGLAAITLAVLAASAVYLV